MPSVLGSELHLYLICEGKVRSTEVFERPEANITTFVYISIVECQKESRFLLPSQITRKMASSIVQPSLLRQSCLSLVKGPALKRQTPQTHPLSTFNASIFRTRSMASCKFSHEVYPRRAIPLSVLRVAGFHATCPRPILPAGPRECN